MNHWGGNVRTCNTCDQPYMRNWRQILGEISTTIEEAEERYGELIGTPHEGEARGVVEGMRQVARILGMPESGE